MKKIIIGAVIATTAVLAGCNYTVDNEAVDLKKETGKVVRLLVNYDVPEDKYVTWVKYEIGNTEDVVSYVVTETCYNTLSVGDDFTYNSNDVIGDGVIEYSITK